MTVTTHFRCKRDIGEKTIYLMYANINVWGEVKQNWTWVEIERDAHLFSTYEEALRKGMANAYQCEVESVAINSTDKKLIVTQEDALQVTYLTAALAVIEAERKRDTPQNVAAMNSVAVAMSCLWGWSSIYALPKINPAKWLEPSS